MRKCLIVIVLIAAATVFANNTMTAQVDTKTNCKECRKASLQYITKETAINAALAHAGLERNKVRDLKCELDRENGVMVYEVEFESGLYDYEYDIDAYTGKVLKSKKEFD